MSKIERTPSGVYEVVVSSAQMPSKVKSPNYRNIAIIERNGAHLDHKSLAIDERNRGVYRIVKQWSRIHVGDTERSEGFRILRDAQKMARRLTEMMVDKY